MEEMQKVFLKAIDLLNEYGWIQGHYYHPSKGYCLMGAINHSFLHGNYFLHNRETIKLMCEYLNLDVISDTSLEEWNDEETTTKESVIELL